MAEGTYEFECMRAELLGIAKPDQEEFEKARAERLLREQEEQLAAEAQALEEQDESMQNTNSKLDELGTILSSTQQKIFRFKQSAAGSLSNIFGRSGSVDVANEAADSSSNASSAGTSRRNTTANTSNINEAMHALDEMKHQEGQPVIPTEKIRQAKMDINKKMTSHLDRLDDMINKADRAEIAMSEQTKQMRQMAK
uniref:t-SNARE coiled-coil homology domain-containing protein n=1 Tax=Stomoxys calcitrans TaxID=35570 RepID=A0A1I8NQA3_STOCA